MVLILFKSENCSYTGDPPDILLDIMNMNELKRMPLLTGRRT